MTNNVFTLISCARINKGRGIRVVYTESAPPDGIGANGALQTADVRKSGGDKYRFLLVGKDGQRIWFQPTRLDAPRVPRGHTFVALVPLDSPASAPAPAPASAPASAPAPAPASARDGDECIPCGDAAQFLDRAIFGSFR